MNKRKIILTGSEGIIGKSLSTDFSVMDEVEIICIDQDLGFDLSDEKQVIDIINNDLPPILFTFIIILIISLTKSTVSRVLINLVHTRVIINTV